MFAEKWHQAHSITLYVQHTLRNVGCSKLSPAGNKNIFRIGKQCDKIDIRLNDKIDKSQDVISHAVCDPCCLSSQNPSVSLTDQLS